MLTAEDIEARIRLYADLRDAMVELSELANSVPEVCPSDLSLESEFLDKGGRMRAVSVVRRAWAGLRAAVLADAQKKVDLAAERVRAFETGEEVQSG